MYSASPSKTPPPEKAILRQWEVTAMLGFSKSKLYEMMDGDSDRFDPTFPKRVPLSSKKNGAVGWKRDELYAWLDSRARI